MKKKILTYFFSLVSLTAFGQDYLVTPTANPSLYDTNDFKFSKGAVNRLKTTVADDSVFYNFDTLSLPFKDDFSSNHFLKPFSKNTNLTYTDTTVYRIYIGGTPYRDTIGLITDTTYVYEIAQDCTVIQRTENIEGFAELHDISTYPTTSVSITHFKPFNVFDTINGGRDTVEVEANLFQDSANFYFVDVPPNIYYTDRDVLLNNTFPILPPSIGVVTFDGLDRNGLPYDMKNPRTVEADYLTSAPLQMGNLGDTNVYMSFYFQPQGISLDGPEPMDSLALDFYNPTLDKWSNLWRVNSLNPNINNEPRAIDTFYQALIKIPNQFHQNGAQFRFRAYAHSSGAFDQWHLDYIYLNSGRSEEDTTYRDIAYIYPARSLLKEHYAMPYWHFQDDPSEYMIDDSDSLWVKNNSDGAFNVFNKVVIPDTVNGGNFYRYPTTNQVSIVVAQEVFAFDYPINFDYQPNDIDSAGVLKAIYDIRFDAQQGGQDLFRSNDTTYSTAILDNYYAYDDGTAEAGYGVNPVQSPGGYFAYIAHEFDQPFADTIGGIQIYFLPQGVDIQNQRFSLMVWDASNSTGPGDLVFKKEQSYRPMYTDDNGFLTLWFDSLVAVGERFYVGIESVGQNSLNIGYDLNNNHKDRIFWSNEGSSWTNPTNGIQDGCLMIRPIYRKSSWRVGLKKYTLKNFDWTVYPNPANNQVEIDLPKDFRLSQVQLYSIQGSLLWQTTNQNELKIDVSNYPEGIYLLRVVNQKGESAHKKIIISHD